MSSTTRALFERLLGEGMTSEAMLSRAVESYKASPAENFGISLIQTGLLTAEQLDTILASGGAPELVAWINLEGRTADEILAKVKKEKRVAVLSALVSREDLPVEIFETLSKVSKSADILTDLVKNPTVPDELRMKATRVVVAGIVKSKQSESVRSAKARAILGALSAEEMVTIYDEFASPYFASIILSGFAVEEEFSERLIADLWKKLSDTANAMVNAPDTVPRKKSYSDYQFAVRDLIDELAAEIWEFWSALRTAQGSTPISEEQETVLHTVVEGIGLGRASFAWDQLGRLKDESQIWIASSEELKKVPVAEITQYQELDQRLTEALQALQYSNVEFATEAYFLHPLADYQLASRMVGHCRLPLHFQQQIVDKLVEEDRLQYAADLAVREQFYDLEDLLKPLRDTEKGKELYEVLYSTLEGYEAELGHTHVRHRRDLILSGFAPIEVILELPAEDLMRLHSALFHQVWQIVEERLGDNQEAWAIFETFVNDGGIAIGTAAETASLL